MKVNVEPAPTWLSTQILPPCNSINFRDRANLRDRHYENVRFDVSKDPSDLHWWINEVQTRRIIVPPLRDKQPAYDLYLTNRSGDTKVPLLGLSPLHGSTQRLEGRLAALALDRIDAPIAAHGHEVRQFRRAPSGSPPEPQNVGHENIRYISRVTEVPEVEPAGQEI